MLTCFVKFILPLLSYEQLNCLLIQQFLIATNISCYKYYSLSNKIILFKLQTHFHQIQIKIPFTYSSIATFPNDPYFKFSRRLTCNEFLIASDRVDNMYQFIFFLFSKSIVLSKIFLVFLTSTFDPEQANNTILSPLSKTQFTI